MSTAFLLRRVSPTLLLALIVSSAHAQTSTPACSLLQTSELEAALGGKATEFHESSPDYCTGKVGKHVVIIRYAERKPESGVTKEEKGIEMLKKQGWQINVKREGDLTVSTAIPPASYPRHDCNTTASIFRNGMVVAVEVGSEDKASMPSTDAVASLVKKAYPRLRK